MRIKLNTVCEAAYEELRRPSYAKAIEMRQAIDTFVDYSDYTSKLANRVAPRTTPDLNVDAIIKKLSQSRADRNFIDRFELAISNLKSKNRHEESLKQAMGVLTTGVLDRTKPGVVPEKFIILLHRLLNEKDSQGKIHIRHNLFSDEAQKIIRDFIIINSGLSKEELNALSKATPVQQNEVLIKLSSQICEIANFALRNPKNMNRISEAARTLPSASVTASVESKPQSQRTPETKTSASAIASPERKLQSQRTRGKRAIDLTHLSDSLAQDLPTPRVKDDKLSRVADEKTNVSRAKIQSVPKSPSQPKASSFLHAPSRPDLAKSQPDEKSQLDQKHVEDVDQGESKLSAQAAFPPNHGRSFAPVNLLKNPDIYLAETWSKVFSSANSFILDKTSAANEAKSANAAANTKPDQPIRFVSATNRKQVITVDAKAVKTRTPPAEKITATAQAMVGIYLKCIKDQKVELHSVKSNNPEMTKQMVLELSKKLQLLNPNDPEIQKHKINGKTIEEISKNVSTALPANPVVAAPPFRPS